MPALNPKVDSFIHVNSQWAPQYEALRRILLTLPLTETIKWGVPCYTAGGKNIVLMHGFNEYCAILFPKGALLKDPEGVLIQQTENTQAQRQIRFTTVAQIHAAEPIIRAYVQEMMELEQAGAKVPFKPATEFAMPDEFREALADDPALHEAFYALTPGRQRGYLLHFGAAKQAKTRQARVEKYIPQIKAGKGLED